MYPTIYEITYWDECNEEMKTKKCLIFSHSYKDAMEEITEYYGDANIDSLFIKLLEEGHINLTANTFNALIRDNTNLI